MSRALIDLHIDVLPRVEAFLSLCHEAAIDILVTCTYRSTSEQAALYAQGRTTPGRIVTWARPGESKHNVMLNGRRASRAVDIVPLRYGKCIWGTSGNGIDNDPTDDDRDDLEIWQRVGALGKRCGLSWAGEWPAGKREFPHFEI